MKFHLPVPFLILSVPLLFAACFKDSPPPPAPSITLAELAKKSSFVERAVDTPVKWLPWGDNALKSAEERKLAILFHIGDSHCTGCEKDLFTAPETVALLNEKSIPVKIDLDLQPGAAKYFGSIVRAAGGEIGSRHDLILVTDSDLRPLGAPRSRTAEGIKEELALLLSREAPPDGSLAWREQAAKTLAPRLSKRVGTTDLMKHSAERLKNRFDAKHAGLAELPKSPLDLPLRFLLRQHRRSGDAELLQMVELTLQRASRGGIRDKKGGFFHEASKDDWSAPLQEKRMTDQALLAMAALETYLVTGKKEHYKLAQELLSEVQEMEAPPSIESNALAASALARAALLLNDAKAHQRATAWTGSLYARLKDGELPRTAIGDGRIAGRLEDYVNLTAALIDVYEATSDFIWLTRAIELQELTDRRFWDGDKKGGGYFASHEGQPGITLREKPAIEHRMPSGNSVAALNLLRLAEITGNKDYKARAEKTLRLLTSAIETDPALAGEALLALDFYLDRPKEIVIVTPRGSRDDSGLLLSELRRHFVPNRVLIVVEAGPTQEEQAKMVPLIAKKYPQKGKATAYVCESGICKFPTSDPAKFGEQITETEPLK